MNESQIYPELKAYLEVGQIAVIEAMWTIVRAYHKPYTALRRTETFDVKITSEIDLSKDPTELLDGVGTRTIHRILHKASLTTDHPLKEGFRIVNEETGITPMGGIHNQPDQSLIIFIDPVDYTMAASRGLDGSVLILFYHLDRGFLVAVAGDLYRRILYWRIANDHSYSTKIDFTQDPSSPFLEQVTNFGASGFCVGSFMV
jgi:hypothetical protein